MAEFEKTVKNLEICRLCLELTVSKMSIFTDDFPQIIEILTSLKVKADDNLPKVSCLKCAKDVKSAFLIRRRIIQSYRTFSNKINRLGTIMNSSHVGIANTNKHIFNTINRQDTNNSNRAYNTSPSATFRNMLNVENPSNTSNELDHIENEPITHYNLNSPDNLHTNVGVINNSPAMSVIIKTEVEKDESSNSSKNEETIDTNDNCKKVSAQLGIQAVKLDVNSKYLDRLKTLQAKQKLTAWKLMNTKDQLHILKWMEKKKVNTKNLTSKLASVCQKKREPLKMYCNTCQIKFTNKIAFKNHMTRHKHKNCPICDKQIRSTYLKKHMALHEQTPVICEVCGQTCKNACSLRMHFFYYHKNPNFCVCEDCGRSFRTKTKLLYHQRKDHTKERNYKCETCGKSFFLKMYLTKHINMKHMKLRPHICEYCGKGFSGRHALRTHVRQHTNEAPYQCILCGERFRQRVSLRGHLKSRHRVEEENTVFCEICGKGFASDVALDVHSRLHSEIKCPWCTDTFADKTYLEQHVTAVHPNIQNDDVIEDGGLKWINL